VSAAGRQRASDIAGFGSAPPAEGRRGSAANEFTGCVHSSCAERIAEEAVTAKNRDIPRQDRQRELLDRPREADVERRCSVTPQT
jgi:hypothetical protein